MDAYGSHPDDTFAKHYVAGWSAPPKIDHLEKVRAKVNKGVAHLSYHRLLDQGTGWQFGEIWLDLARLLGDFARRASPDRLPPKAAKKIIELVQPIDAFDAFHMAPHLTSHTRGHTVTTASRSRPIIADVSTASVHDLFEYAKHKTPPT